MDKTPFASLRLILLLLCMVNALGTVSLLAQDDESYPYQFRVLDEIELMPIADVELKCPILPIRYSDQRGVLEIPTNLDTESQLTFSHPEYEDLVISAGDLFISGRTVFLTPKSIRMSEVVLTASKFAEKKEDVPQQISVITSREVEFLNPQTSADLLAQSGGVFVQKSQQGGGSPNLRGFEANKVLIVVDGVRLNNAIFRGGHLQNVITIDPNMVDRAEVLYGPASVMYGSDALGGVMHFYSRKPLLSTDDKMLFKMNGFTRLGSANLEQSGHLDVNFGWKKFAFLTSISGSSFSDLVAGKRHHPDYPTFGRRDSVQAFIDGQDTVITNNNPYRQQSSGYDQVDFMQKILFQQSEKIRHLLNFQYSTSSDVPRYDRLTQVSGGTFRNAQWYYGPQKRMLASYHGTYDLGFGLVDATVAYQDLEESRHTRRFGSSNLRNREERVQVLSVNLDGRTEKNERHEIGYGLEAAFNFVQSSAFTYNISDATTSALDTRYPDGGSTMRFLAAYASYHFEAREDLIFSTGLRATSVALEANFDDKSFFPFLPDQIRQDNFAPSGNLGLVYEPGENWRFSAQGATGFRAPNVDDVGKVFDSSPGNVIVPNPNVTPEYTYSGELSVTRKFGDWLRISVNAWQTWYRNALVIRNFTYNGQDSIIYDGVLSRVQANVNTKTALLRGLNFNIELRPTRGFLLTHTQSFTYGRDTDADVPLDHIPPMFGKTSVQYSRKKFKTEVFSLFNGWKRLDDYSPSGEDNLIFATADGTYAWATLNFRVGYSINSSVRVQAGIDNILDAHYRHFASGISAPGRNFYATLRFSR